MSKFILVSPNSQVDVVNLGKDNGNDSRIRRNSHVNGIAGTLQLKDSGTVIALCRFVVVVLVLVN